MNLFDLIKKTFFSLGISLPLLIILIQIYWENYFGTYDLFLQDCLQEYAHKSVSQCYCSGPNSCLHYIDPLEIIHIHGVPCVIPERKYFWNTL